MLPKKKAVTYVPLPRVEYIPLTPKTKSLSGLQEAIRAASPTGNSLEGDSIRRLMHENVLPKIEGTYYVFADVGVSFVTNWRVQSGWKMLLLSSISLNQKKKMFAGKLILVVPGENN